MASPLGDGGYSGLIGASLDISSSGDNTVVAVSPGTIIRVYKLFLVIGSTNVTVQFKNGASINLTPVLTMLKNGSIVLDYDGLPWFETTNGKNFVIRLGGAVQVSGRIYYIQE